MTTEAIQFSLVLARRSARFRRNGQCQESETHDFQYAKSRLMISRVRQWLAAIRSVSKTAQEAGRAVAAVPQLDENIAQIREESNRLSTLYEAVTGRTAIATDDILKLNAQILQLTDTIVQMREESNRLSALHEEEAKRLSTLHEEKFSRLSALHDEESNRLSALHEESDRLSALHEEESGRLSALHEEESGRLSALQEESNRLSDR